MPIGSEMNSTEISTLNENSTLSENTTSSTMTLKQPNDTLSLFHRGQKSGDGVYRTKGRVRIFT